MYMEDNDEGERRRQKSIKRRNAGPVRGKGRSIPLPMRTDPMDTKGQDPGDTEGQDAKDGKGQDPEGTRRQNPNVPDK
jgi:hypothetical protein